MRTKPITWTTVGYCREGDKAHQQSDLQQKISEIGSVENDAWDTRCLSFAVSQRENVQLDSKHQNGPLPGYKSGTCTLIYISLPSSSERF